MKGKLKILVATDGSECGDAALVDMKRAGLPRKAEAHVLSVSTEWIPASAGYGLLEPDFSDQLQAFEKEALAIARRGQTVVKDSFPEWEVHAEAATGSPAGVILHRSEELKSDLIILGSHGRSAIGRLFLGSVSQKVLHAARGTVRLARARVGEPGMPLRLIVGVDGSQGAEATVKAVAERHWPPGSEARVVNGFPVLPPTNADYLPTAMAAWLADERARVGDAVEKAVGRLKGAGLTVSGAMKDEDARLALVSEADDWKADCIFVGARGMSAIERFMLGSVSSYVATHAHCSVEVVKDQD